MKLHLIGLLAAFCASFVLLLIILPLLRKLKAGQYILGYVKEHKNKGGTPTMGGLAFIAALIAVSLCVLGISDGRVNLALAITGGYTFVGFLDDYLKISRKENEGLKPYQKIIFQVAIAIVAAVYCFINKLTVLYVPFFGNLSFDIGLSLIHI